MGSIFKHIVCPWSHSPRLYRCVLINSQREQLQLHLTNLASGLISGLDMVERVRHTPKYLQCLQKVNLGSLLLAKKRNVAKQSPLD